MGRNGRERDTRDELRREAADRLAAVKRTAAALEDRLRERSEQVGEVIDRTRDQLHGVDDLVHKYRYLFIGGALGVGFAIARRGRRRTVDALEDGGDERIRYVMVDRPRQGVVRSLLGGLAALALRQGASWLTHQLTPDDEEREQHGLPPGKPRR